jgi:hypothetical protein
MLSSLILNLGNYDKYPSLDWAKGVGMSMLAFGLSTIVLGALIMATGVGIGLAALGLGIVGTLLVATAIMVASHILKLGDYSKYPSLDWAQGVGLSLTAFGLASLVLGFVMLTGVGAIAMALGLYSTMMIANTIVATAAILNTGNYSRFPSFDWASGVGLSLTTFGLGSLILGTILMTGVGALALYLGLSAIESMANTIVNTGKILATGQYDTYPSTEWATGIINTLSKFAIFGVTLGIAGLVGGKVVSYLADNIVELSSKLALGNYNNYPTEEWARGVTQAIMALEAINPISLLGVMFAINKFAGIDGKTIDNIERLAGSIGKLALAMNQLNSVVIGDFLKFTQALFAISMIDNNNLGRVLSSLSRKEQGSPVLARVTGEKNSYIGDMIDNMRNMTGDIKTTGTVPKGGTVSVDQVSKSTDQNPMEVMVKHLASMDTNLQKVSEKYLSTANEEQISENKTKHWWD